MPRSRIFFCSSFLSVMAFAQPPAGPNVAGLEMRRAEARTAVKVAALPAEAPAPAKSTETRPAEPKPTASIGLRTLAPEIANALPLRNLGPAAMSGRVAALAVAPSDPTVWYVASASGGLFKTTNAGTTFTPCFDHEATVSIGAVAVSAADPNLVWVGAGEVDSGHSASSGDGVHKSVDGGRTWTNMGLRKSFQIGRIVVDPRNPDTVYVGALGRLWGDGEERGVFKTVDGGRSWERVLFLDARTGCVDLLLAPDDPQTLIAAMYERRRDRTDDADSPAEKRPLEPPGGAGRKVDASEAQVDQKKDRGVDVETFQRCNALAGVAKLRIVVFVGNPYVHCPELPRP